MLYWMYYVVATTQGIPKKRYGTVERTVER